MDPNDASRYGYAPSGPPYMGPHPHGTCEKSKGTSHSVLTVFFFVVVFIVVFVVAFANDDSLSPRRPLPRHPHGPTEAVPRRTTTRAVHREHDAREGSANESARRCDDGTDGRSDGDVWTADASHRLEAAGRGILNITHTPPAAHATHQRAKTRRWRSDRSCAWSSWRPERPFWPSLFYPRPYLHPATLQLPRWRRLRPHQRSLSKGSSQQHHQTPSNIIKHHQTSSNIIKHHQTSLLSSM